MTDEQYKKIEALFSEKECLANIKTGLTEIIDMISDLSQCSADDFLYLNEQLQNFHKYFDIWSKKINVFYDALTDEEYIILFNELKKQLEVLKNESQIIYKENNESVLLAQNIQNQLEMVFLPLQSLNHNLMILYFLTTNLNLNLSYFNKSNILAQQRRIIRDYIVRNRSDFPDFFYKTAKLNDSLTTVLQQSDNHKTNQALNIKITEKTLESLSKLFDVKTDQVNQHKKATLNTHQDSTYQHFNKIIINLQYQDIIRQRMEHVQLAHKHILDDLAQFERIEGTTPEIILSQYSKIKQIIGIQGAQLIATNQDYETAINNILNTFQEISIELKSIRTLIKSIFEIDDPNNDFFSNITLQSEDIHKNVDNISKSSSTFFDFFTQKSEEINELKLFISETIESKKNTDAVLDFLEHDQEIKTISDPIVYKNIGQIRDVLAKINEIFYSLKAYEQKFSEINHKIEKIIHESESDKVKQKADQINKKIQEIIQKTNLNKSTAAQIFNQYSVEDEELINTKKLTKNIQYFNQFDNLGAKIIDKLNSIYALFSTDIGDKDDQTLEDLAKQYTMAKEREIHQKVIHDQTKAFKANENKQIEGNDVELF